MGIEGGNYTTGNTSDDDYEAIQEEAKKKAIQKSDADNLQKMSEHIEKKQTFVGQLGTKVNALYQKEKAHVDFAQQNAQQQRAMAEYAVNFFYRDNKGQWQFLRTVNKYGETTVKELNNKNQEVAHKRKEIDLLRNTLRKQGTVFVEKMGDPSANLKELRGKSYAGQITDKWKKNVQGNVANIKKEAPGMATDINKALNNETVGIPRMAVDAPFSTTNKSQMQQIPNYNSPMPVAPQSSSKRRTPIRPLRHEEYQSYIDNGYTVEQMDDMGFKDKRSPYYQEQSVFGRGVVPYRPIGTWQANSFRSSIDRTRPLWLDRIGTGVDWEPFHPDQVEVRLVGTKDEFGNSKSMFHPPTFDPMKPDMFGRKRYFVLPKVYTL